MKFDFSEFDLIPNSLERERVVFTPEMDEALRRYWKVKRQHDVAKKLGISANTCRKRYRELMNVQGV